MLIPVSSPALIWRQAERNAEARRTEEVERTLEEARHRPFDKPAQGRTLKTPAEPPKLKEVCLATCYRLPCGRVSSGSAAGG